MKFKPLPVFLVLSLLFLTYSFSIYLFPLSKKKSKHHEFEQAVAGRLVWQKYNCQSCHQFYGLGGYLGPDLTNVYSKPGKGPVLINAMVKNGSGAMPAYQLSEKEMDLLLAFLKMTDESGTSDPRNFSIHADGTINQK